MKKFIFILLLSFILSGCTAPDFISKHFDKNFETANSNFVLENVYKQASDEYTINYPKEWITQKARANTTVFSGEKGNESYETIVKIQKFEKPEDTEMSEAIIELINRLKVSALMQSEKTKFYDEKIYIYQSSQGLEIEGKELLIEFILKDNKRFREWLIIVPSPDNENIYYWGYNAPQRLYDKYLDTAKAMLDSWEIKNIEIENKIRNN